MLQSWIFRIFIIWYCVGVVLVPLNLLPAWLEWANAVFLYLAGTVAAIYGLKRFGNKKGTMVALFVFFSTIFFEHLGVEYGLIFGSYQYEKDFGIQLLGVPITIGAAWMLVFFTSDAWSERILDRFQVNGKARFIFHILITSLLAVIMDLIIDPVAYKVKEYWLWEGTSFYYGIPMSNFFGWFIVSAFLHLVLYRFRKNKKDDEVRVWQNRMILLYLLIVIMFSITALVGKVFAAVVLTWLALSPFIWFVKRGKQHD